jgi:hypothetical protein
MKSQLIHEKGLEVYLAQKNVRHNYCDGGDEDNMYMRLTKLCNLFRSNLDERN